MALHVLMRVEHYGMLVVVLRCYVLREDVVASAVFPRHCGGKMSKLIGHTKNEGLIAEKLAFIVLVKINSLRCSRT